MKLIKRRKPVGFFPTTFSFNELYEDWPVMDWTDNFFNDEKWVPAANVKEEEGEFIVELSVPGYKKKDIHVEVNKDGTMFISGENKTESKEEDENYMRKEFSSGSFYRSFKLPVNVNANEIVAKCENGLLRVTLPKLELAEKKNTVREIEIA